MTVDKSKLRAPNGKMITQGLFLEMYTSADYAIYTLGEEDVVKKGKTYISLKKRYLECNDPTEWEFVNKWLISWPHWEAICQNKMLQPHIEQWRKELEIKLRSQAVKEMLTKSEDPKNVTATKWLAEGQWRPKRAAGAPSKEERQRATAIETGIRQDVEEDLERMAKWH